MPKALSACYILRILFHLHVHHICTAYVDPDQYEDRGGNIQMFLDEYGCIQAAVVSKGNDSLQWWDSTPEINKSKIVSL